MDKLPLAGVVITMNEAANIQRCLGSLSFCSELLVIDSGSSDETVALAVFPGIFCFSTYLQLMRLQGLWVGTA
jgi:hypothetical protein